jgi:hypothetical protein
MIMALAVLVPVATAEDHEYFPQSVASGDPRPTSVVLWTRIDNPEMPDAIRVDVATDEVFTDVVFTRELTASADNDWCLKVLATGLMPYTTYYYRFVYGSGAAMVYSPVGRTKTAPTPDMDVPARFAVVYCQDYTGRYYNSYAKLLADYDEEIDFVVHLGDYIYETTGGSTDDPEESDRTIVFEDLEGAIPIGSPDEPRLAAGSLANYRTIYKTYRSDPMLRKVHERWPMNSPMTIGAPPPPTPTAAATSTTLIAAATPNRRSSSGYPSRLGSAMKAPSRSTPASSIPTPGSIATSSTARTSTWCCQTREPTGRTTSCPRMRFQAPSRLIRRI